MGLLTKLDLYKKVENFSEHFLSPKILLRFAPGEMRKEEDNSKLNPSKAFSLNRLNNNNNFESGLSATIGFDYEIKDQNKKIDLSISQIFNEKENKKRQLKVR